MWSWGVLGEYGVGVGVVEGALSVVTFEGLGPFVGVARACDVEGVRR